MPLYARSCVVCLWWVFFVFMFVRGDLLLFVGSLFAHFHCIGITCQGFGSGFRVWGEVGGGWGLTHHGFPNFRVEYC